LTIFFLIKARNKRNVFDGGTTHLRTIFVRKKMWEEINSLREALMPLIVLAGDQREKTNRKCLVRQTQRSVGYEC